MRRARTAAATAVALTLAAAPAGALPEDPPVVTEEVCLTVRPESTTAPERLYGKRFHVGEVAARRRAIVLVHGKGRNLDAAE